MERGIYSAYQPKQRVRGQAKKILPSIRKILPFSVV